MNSDLSSLICAPATAPGSSAIAVVRVSGPGCIVRCEPLFRLPSGKLLGSFPGNRVLFARLMDGQECVDEVLVTLFRAPHSFTGEESLEISCHGSPYILQRVLELLVKHGVRPARPGEFTQRAFLNGKMDLSQAEAVADLIASSSAATHRMAMTQMRGGYSAELRALREELLQLTSLLELELDFSEEDVEFADRATLQQLATRILSLIDRLCRSFSLGNVLKNGVPVAIVGHTNVGKSTLLNALLREDRAIVSDIAGTTRDVIEECINVGGIQFRFIDTAGIRDTTDRIESLGIERTYDQISRARIVLLLADATRPDATFRDYYRKIYSHLPQEASLFVLLNKIDTFEPGEAQNLLQELTESLQTAALPTSSDTSPQAPVQLLPISAKQGTGLDALLDALTTLINTDPLESGETIVSNLRHYQALSSARQSLQRALEGLQTTLSAEFISQDIRETIHYLGEITGEVSTDEVLGRIFERFCIGK